MVRPSRARRKSVVVAAATTSAAAAARVVAARIVTAAVAGVVVHGRNGSRCGGRRRRPRRLSASAWASRGASRRRLARGVAGVAVAFGASCSPADSGSDESPIVWVDSVAAAAVIAGDEQHAGDGGETPEQ